MFPKFSKQAFNRLAQSVKEMNEFEDSLGIEEKEYSELTQDQADELLISSAEKGDVNKVIDALEAGADVYAIDEALQEASYWGHIEVVKLLLKNAANPFAHNEKALRNAVYKGHTEIVELLKQYM